MAAGWWQTFCNEGSVQNKYCRTKTGGWNFLFFRVLILLCVTLCHAVMFLFCAGWAYHDRAPGAGKCVSSLNREVAPRVPVWERAPCHFVLDYCSGGELFYHLGRCGKLGENVAIFYSAQITLALYYLHSKTIAYRDLKPENILLDSEGYIRLGKQQPNKHDRTSVFAWCRFPCVLLVRKPPIGALLMCMCVWMYLQLTSA